MGIKRGDYTMAGYSKLYAIGGSGGFMGADGINPIELMILVGDSNRQWYEPHYFTSARKPLGRIRVMIPAGPNDLDAVLDACIVFCPWHFGTCPSLPVVESAFCEAEVLDFHLGGIPEQWRSLREEARPIFVSLNMWSAELVPYDRGSL